MERNETMLRFNCVSVTSSQKLFQIVYESALMNKETVDEMSILVEWNFRWSGSRFESNSYKEENEQKKRNFTQTKY